MKRVFLVLLLLLTVWPSLAQTPRAKDFLEVSDSLSQRMQRRSGVKTRVRVNKVLARGKTLDFYFTSELVYHPWRPGEVAWFRQQLQESISGYTLGKVYGGNQDISDLEMPALRSDGKPVETPFLRPDPRTETPPLVSGSKWWGKGLSGRHIALWQSHGRYWSEKRERWEWQRGPAHRTVEDIYTQSYVVPFLMPMLENAGAVVLSPRERDPQTHEIVCDNDPSFGGERTPDMRSKGSYKEKGNWKDAGTGFADARAIYRDYENPFIMGTARQTEVSSKKSGAEAIWRPDIPEQGRYAVYVSYVTLPNSTTDARYTVHHLGGETLLHVNQQMGGGSWVYLGTFLFAEGTEGYVSLSSQSSAGGVITADAVRFGGGMGKVERGGITSGYPAYTEGALYNMQYSGLDLTLLDDWKTDYVRDYAGRGVWVQNLSGGSRIDPKAKGRRVPVDLSLAFHSDAGITPNDSIIGTLGIYTLKDRDHKEVFANGESRMNSRLLTDFVQTQLVQDIQAQFEPNWTRRGTWDRSYSESRSTGVPGMLLEIHSHQNFADMRYGLDPSYRFTASRAIYKGILKYLSARYGSPYVVQPLPVHAFQVRLDDTYAVLSWEPTTDSLEVTAKPTYYRVYARRGPADFDEGRQIEGNSCTLPLEKGHLYSFKVTACNEGGESFPSEILCAGLPDGAAGKEVLVVNNFTRVSAPTWFDTPTYAGFTEGTDSGVPWGQDLLYAGEVNQFNRQQNWTSDDNPGFGGCYTDQAGQLVAGNSFDFVARHGHALLEAGYAVSSSSAEAFDGASPAFAVDLICGKQVTSRIGRGAVPDRYHVFPESLQQALRRFTSSGGNVLISGSYIGTDAWDSIYPGVERAPESTRKFVKDVLGYFWVTNFGDRTGQVLPVSGLSLPAVSYNRDWSPTVYRVENPDGIGPASDRARVMMRYHRSGVSAATLYEAPGYKVAAFGFPLETSPQLPELLSSIMNMISN